MNGPLYTFIGRNYIWGGNRELAWDWRRWRKKKGKQRGRGTSSRAAYPPLHPIVWGCQGLGEVTSCDKLRQVATSYDVATTWLPRDKSSATCSCSALWNLLFHLFCVKPCLISHTQDLQLLLFISPHILSVDHLQTFKTFVWFPITAGLMTSWWLDRLPDQIHPGSAMCIKINREHCNLLLLCK